MSYQTIREENPDPHLWLIELLLHWQGGFNSRDLCRYFAVSRQQAAKYIQRYKALHPSNLTYCSHLKLFVPCADFVSRFISGDVSEYLDWLNLGSKPEHCTLGQSNDVSLTNASLSLPRRQVSPVIMQALVAAIRSRQRLEIGYVSFATPQDQGRVIQPHTFVKTGLRWHLRAYCEKSADFRDFVLSRFRGEPALSGPATHLPGQDQGWHTQVQLVFEPDPRLSPAQRQIIEQDYQMQHGQLRLTTRAALAQYLLQEMQVSTKFLAGSGEAQQLVLVNKDDIKPWLFDS
ncbi:helix-turn-helix transcriptional regulator [Bowmanella dokdonensis]|uniref:WYL domain-containing protein n=1 Tax=Bowmanella dokdonensis TaxID=751969 RepID=A0A939DQG1_9ALTE|nr:WYL domain-containing protein [Bowmanella dokdonensis]MBN7826497.1 WYL domain-containing protein [Bowmanella dokdonensis]